MNKLFLKSLSSAYPGRVDQYDIQWIVLVAVLKGAPCNCSSEPGHQFPMTWVAIKWQAGAGAL